MLGPALLVPAKPLCSSLSHLWLPLAPVGGIAPPSVSPHWLPLLRTCELRCALPFRTAFRGGGWYRSTFGLSSSPPFALLDPSSPCFASLEQAALRLFQYRPSLADSCGGGWYRSTFGLSSPPPCASLHSTRARLASLLYATFHLWHRVVSLHLRSFLDASLCYTLLHLAFPRFAMVCYTPFVPVATKFGRPLAPVDGIAPSSVIPHWLPVLSLALLYYAKTSFTYLGTSMFRGGGGFRSRCALSHRLPLLYYYRPCYTLLCPACLHSG